ncbi:KOW motif-containing protein [Streptomyces sp. NBC_01267]|uniref:KOW motif-containing protein n=1 Tax=Streptomyces sp. NBC_01267 TaxID=2903805 RepID=UPI002E3803BF|nr:KOW motif-containing protein [Streptomyces sp. NBC_01267]
MTKYTAPCDVTPDDTVTAFKDARHVILTPSTRVDVCLTPTAARTFARGILALADEIDGGETPEPARAPRVGDRVRVLEDDPGNRAGEFVGKVGTLLSVDKASEYTPYCVQFGDGTGYYGKWWVDAVELLTTDVP